MTSTAGSPGPALGSPGPALGSPEPTTGSPEPAAGSTEPTAGSPGPVFHLAEAEHWEAARESGRYERSSLGVSLAEEGFIHLSTAAQWPGVLDRYYRDHDGDLVLLTIDPALVESEIRWETGGSAADELFPHLYGPLPVGAVTATRVLTPPFGGPAA